MCIVVQGAEPGGLEKVSRRAMNRMLTADLTREVQSVSSRSHKVWP
jgi:hypothetical protein